MKDESESNFDPNIGGFGQCGEQSSARFSFPDSVPAMSSTEETSKVENWGEDSDALVDRRHLRVRVSEEALQDCKTGLEGRLLGASARSAVDLCRLCNQAVNLCRLCNQNVPADQDGLRADASGNRRICGVAFRAHGTGRPTGFQLHDSLEAVGRPERRLPKHRSPELFEELVAAQQVVVVSV